VFTVFNVGQGDAFYLKPESHCVFNERGLLIDTGFAKAKVSTRLKEDPIDVMITHAHGDHVGGLGNVLKTKIVHEMFFPYYLPEVIKIIGYLKGYTTIALTSPNWNKIRQLKYRLVSEGDDLCNHLHILNPSKTPDIFQSKNSPEDMSIETAIERLTQVEIDLPRQEIIEYEPPLTDDHEAQLPPDQRATESNYRLLSRRFVHGFFISLVQQIDGMTVQNRSFYLDRHIHAASNHVSIVFKYNHCQGDWLFTGDADLAVFGRLMLKGDDIRAKFIKIPHHGSRDNFSQDVLDAVSPTHAIVSHCNGVFGNSRDPHPHTQIIDLLDKNKVTSFYTNPVIKKKMQIKPSTTGQVLGGLINFV
jgi:beta-lactamase superfamily II metal-dependent hydrolase